MLQLVSSDIVGKCDVIAEGDFTVIRRAIVELVTGLIGQPYWQVSSQRNGWPRIVVAPASGCAPLHYSVREI